MATFSTSYTCQMWRISDSSTSAMWRHLKFLQMWRNFRNLHIYYMEKSEISPHDRFFLHKYNLWYLWQIWGLHQWRSFGRQFFLDTSSGKVPGKILYSSKFFSSEKSFKVKREWHQPIDLAMAEAGQRLVSSSGTSQEAIKTCNMELL